MRFSWGILDKWFSCLCFSSSLICGVKIIKLLYRLLWGLNDNYKCLKHLSGEGNGNPLQYSCLESPMNGGAWWAVVHGVAKSQTRLSNFTFTFLNWRRKWQPTPVFFAWRIPGIGEPGGLLSMGSHRVGHDWSNLAAAKHLSAYASFDQSYTFCPVDFKQLSWNLIQMHFISSFKGQKWHWRLSVGRLKNPSSPNFFKQT